MGHLNPHSSKTRSSRQWRLLDIVTAMFFAAVLLFFILVFTPLGDSLATSGLRTLLRSSGCGMHDNNIAERKGHQGWMKKEGPHRVFDGRNLKARLSIIRDSSEVIDEKQLASLVPSRITRNGENPGRT